MSGDSQPNYQSLLQRGELLRDQRRYAESEKFLQEAIALQPASADAYYELAFCYCNWDGHEAKGLETIDRAISLEPNRSEFFALRAWILGNLNRNKEAILTADQALELNPQNVLALNAQTRAYNDLHNWPQTEIHARRVLQINARNELAANFLSISLRQQGRLQESRAVTTGLLGQSPDNALTQSNAGWSALQEGDYRGANQHFLEALRLNPNYENARAGLLHSFNSRVWIYRLYFQFIARIGRYRKEMRILFLVIVYVGYRVVLTELRTRFGREGIHWALVVIAL
jgi:tetratricopeptide (TPR) repeat protein